MKKRRTLSGCLERRFAPHVSAYATLPLATARDRAHVPAGQRYRLATVNQLHQRPAPAPSAPIQLQAQRQLRRSSPSCDTRFASLPTLQAYR